LITCGLILCLATTASEVFAQQQQEQTIQAAAAVLNETMSTPGNRIPQAMLADAHGVAIIPNVIKGGFVVGARHGRGVLFIREAGNVWHAPVFITLTGGNIGWQAGLQSSDIILVFKTQQSIQGILSGKLTLGADAAAAAGPVGRQTAMATDGKLSAEIYTYSRSRGLFAGVSIDGSVLRIDQLATGAYYQSSAPGQPMVIPPSAQQLTQTVAAYAGSAAPVTAAPGVSPTAGSTIPGSTPVPGTPAIPGAPQASGQPLPVPALQHRANDEDVLRNQLTQLAPQLYELIDDQWKEYLALPSSMFLTGPHPSAAEITETLQRFDRVANDPAFAQLAARPEFQSVYGLLKHYQQALTSVATSVNLPPPPSSDTPAIR
jgi:lipid-binding SYLF domain-containing protein